MQGLGPGLQEEDVPQDSDRSSQALPNQSHSAYSHVASSSATPPHPSVSERESGIFKLRNEAEPSAPLIIREEEVTSARKR